MIRGGRPWALNFLRIMMRGPIRVPAAWMVCLGNADCSLVRSVADTLLEQSREASNDVQIADSGNRCRPPRNSASGAPPGTVMASREIGAALPVKRRSRPGKADRGVNGTQDIRPASLFCYCPSRILLPAQAMDRRHFRRLTHCRKIPGRCQHNEDDGAGQVRLPPPRSRNSIGPLPNRH